MRILLVEDDRQLRTSVARGLREAGHHVDEATDGVEALEAAVAGTHDCVILDILLPRRDGIEVCRELRARNNWVPILMLTALDAVEHRIEGLDAGADDYLGKPFSLGELLARLRAVARRPALADLPMTVLEAGALCLDVSRHKAFMDGKPLELTPTEFRLLEVLIRHAGRLVTRAMLLEQVWNFNFNPRTGLVETHLSRLRAKVRGRDDSDSPIETVRGYGYRLRIHVDPA
jgi:two-component system OmpR family response regulator